MVKCEQMRRLAAWKLRGRVSNRLGAHSAVGAAFHRLLLQIESELGSALTHDTAEEEALKAAKAVLWSSRKSAAGQQGSVRRFYADKLNQTSSEYYVSTKCKTE